MKTKSRKPYNSNVKGAMNFNHHSIGVEYTKYKKKIPEKSRLGGREEIKNFASLFFKKIADSIIETEGGVHIRGLGYFFVWQIPKKKSYKKFDGGEYKGKSYCYHTDMYIYTLVYLPQNSLKFWGMDGAFNYNIKRGISNNLKSGKRYKNFAFTLRRELLKRY